MSPIHCLIVDDEPIAREIIQSYCSHLDGLHVVASCSSALEAKSVLQKQPIDLLFLDINMPLLDGIAFLRTIKNPPAVIFTTAYKEYAVDAFELAASDYLLKPFSLERFIIAIDKVLVNRNVPAVEPVSRLVNPPDDYLFLKVGGKIYKLLHHDLLFAEAQGNNTKLVTSQITLMPSMSFSSLDERLPKQLFVRVHRSYLVNKAKVTHIEGNRVYLDKHEIPIGANYRDQLLKEIGL